MVQLGVADSDDAAKAVLCSIWNGVYSLGAAIGPLVTAVLFGARGFFFTVASLLAFSAGVAAILIAFILTSAAGPWRRTHGAGVENRVRSRGGLISPLLDTVAEEHARLSVVGPSRPQTVQ